MWRRFALPPRSEAERWQLKTKLQRLLDDAYGTLRTLTPILERRGRGLGALVRSVRGRLSKLKIRRAISVTLARQIFQAAKAVDVAAKSAHPSTPNEIESKLGELGELLRRGLGDDAN